MKRGSRTRNVCTWNTLSHSECMPCLSVLSCLSYLSCLVVNNAGCGSLQRENRESKGLDEGVKWERASPHARDITGNTVLLKVIGKIRSWNSFTDALSLILTCKRIVLAAWNQAVDALLPQDHTYHTYHTPRARQTWADLYCLHLTTTCHILISSLFTSSCRRLSHAGQKSLSSILTVPALAMELVPAP